MGIRKRKPRFNNRYKGLEFRVCMVRENREPPEEITIRGPDDVYDLVREELAHADREVFLSILLTVKNMVIGVETVSIGAINSCFVAAREIFKGAMLANAVAIILCHNHPSGGLAPSDEDIRFTEKITKAGELMGIRLMDHLIVSHQGYRSISHKQS